MVMYEYDGQRFTLHEVERDYVDYVRECINYDERYVSWEYFLSGYQEVEDAGDYGA